VAENYCCNCYRKNNFDDRSFTSSKKSRSLISSMRFPLLSYLLPISDIPWNCILKTMLLYPLDSIIYIKAMAQFSDVIVLAGHWWVFICLFSFLIPESVIKKVTSRRPLNCTLKFRFNWLFFGVNHLKQSFPLAWTPFPFQPGNWIMKLPIGARNGLKIDHLT
jgi:hypothetical protein